MEFTHNIAVKVVLALGLTALIFYTYDFLSFRALILPSYVYILKELLLVLQ